MQLFFPQTVLIASFVLAQVSVQQTNSTSLAATSFTPLFQPTSQTSSTVLGASQTSLMSNPTGVPLFHVVSPSSTLTGYPTMTSAATTSSHVATGSKKSAAGHVGFLMTATVLVLGMVMGLVAVL
ncbi:hypothetical protein BDR22DRAFT_886190 [Usnea florida]